MPLTPEDLARVTIDKLLADSGCLVQDREAAIGWVWTNLDTIRITVGGVTEGQLRKIADVIRSVPYLRVANVQRAYLDLTEVKKIDATEQVIAELRPMPNDLLFNEVGDRDKLGRRWIWEGQIAECIHQMKRAFEGKLVPHDPNDEPASVLMECIRSEMARQATPNKLSRATRSSS